MGEFLVQLVEMIMKIGSSGSGGPKSCMFGADVEKREERRSALWVLGLLVFFIGGGWLLFHWLLDFSK